MGTVVAAKRRLPFSGTPDVDPQWTDPDVDAGSIYPVAAPVRGAGAYGATLADNTLAYNDLPMLLAAFFGGGVTPTGAGASKTWHFTPAADGTDAFDPFTYEHGDDVATDVFQLGDGILTGLSIATPEAGGGVLTASGTWRFGSAASTGSTDSPVTGTVPTPGLTLDLSPTPVYVKDCSVWIDSTAAGLGTTQLTNSVHSFTLNATQEVDDKRYANGTQSFAVDDYGRASAAIELAVVYAKTADTVGTGSEADAWFSDTSVPRFVKIGFESLAIAESGSPDIPYSWVINMPMRYYTRAEGALGGNSTVILTAHAFLEDVTLHYAFDTTVVNTLASTGI